MHGLGPVAGGHTGGGGDEHFPAAGGGHNASDGGHAQGEVVVHGDAGVDLPRGQQFLHDLVLFIFGVSFHNRQGGFALGSYSHHP